MPEQEPLDPKQAEQEPKAEGEPEVEDLDVDPEEAEKVSEGQKQDIVIC